MALSLNDVKKHAKKRDSLIEKVYNDYDKGIAQSEKEVYAASVSFLNSLDTDKGKIKNTKSNLYKVNGIDNYLDASYKLFNKTNDRLRKSIGNALDISNEFHKSISDQIKYSKAELKYLDGLTDSLFNAFAGGNDRIRDVVFKNISGMITNETTFKTAVENIQRVTIEQGILRRYASTYAKTGFTLFEQSLYNIKNKELGTIEWYWSGSLSANSRDLCLKFAGKTVTKSELNQLDRSDWQGKIPGYPIMVQVGGFNCQHQLTPSKFTKY